MEAPDEAVAESVVFAEGVEVVLDVVSAALKAR